MICEGNESLCLLVENWKSSEAAWPEKKTPMKVTKKLYNETSPKDKRRHPYLSGV